MRLRAILFLTPFALAAACGGLLAPSSNDDAGASSSGQGAKGGGDKGGANKKKKDDDGIAFDPGDATVTALPPTKPPPLGKGSVACGTSNCATEASGDPSGGCCVTPGDPHCLGSSERCGRADFLQCDDGADCKTGVCCAEGFQFGQRMQTRCLPTCITDLERIQVCGTDAECGKGETCKPYDGCLGRSSGIKLCSRPSGCP